MPRTTIHPDGRITYRTALFRSYAKARSFGICLTANNSRFEKAMVHCSGTSKTPSWFVTFEPKSRDRKRSLCADQQNARSARAEAQRFLFWPDPDRRTWNGEPSFWWCLSVTSGETYEVSPHGCTCWDYSIRCAPAGIECKHMLALSDWRSRGKRYRNLEFDWSDADSESGPAQRAA